MFVITGGGSGIGRSLAKALATRGKKVLIVGRQKDNLLETAEFSSLISICCADVSSEKGQQKIVSSLDGVAQLEGLVHNAGTIEPLTPMATMDTGAWQQALATNLNAPLFLTQLLLARLTTGRVLNIGTAAAYFPIAACAAYCVSKAALSMLTRCWQLESKQTIFASVMPGIVDTTMQALMRQSTFMEKDSVHFYETLQREERLLTPQTVALFLSWLLLDVSNENYAQQEWDIYDTKHHHSWLVRPHQVPHWE